MGEVEFLPADKHESFLQDCSITLGVISQTCPKYEKQSVYNNFAISQGNNEGWCCVWPGISKLPKITSFWWVWSSIPKVSKKASLQCLYNIPKKVRGEVHIFDPDKHQSYEHSWHQSFLQCGRHDNEDVKDMVMGMIKHCQST